MNAMVEEALSSEEPLEQLTMLRKVLCDSLSLKAKIAIQGVADDLLVENASDRYALPGDDCAAFPIANGYQLLAMEGMLPEFVQDAPWHAGWSAVMANVSDIAAMGGRATAIVNAFWHNNQTEAAQLINGIKDACDTFGLTLAGGHTNITNQNRPGLAVAIMGFATHLLSCHHVRAGQQLFMVSDLTGEWHRDKPYWSVIPGKSREQIRQMWELLPQLAESGLIDAAKDISNAGVIGTLLMLLELNSLGAEIDLEQIPRPASEANWLRWLMAFQSYGYLLVGAPENAGDIIRVFSDHHLTCQAIGQVTEHPTLNVTLEDARLEFWNFNDRAVTGLALPRS